jgi:hypothetical protein
MISEQPPFVATPAIPVLFAAISEQVGRLEASPLPERQLSRCAKHNKSGHL